HRVRQFQRFAAVLAVCLLGLAGVTAWAVRAQWEANDQAEIARGERRTATQRLVEVQTTAVHQRVASRDYPEALLWVADMLEIPDLPAEVEREIRLLARALLAST